MGLLGVEFEFCHVRNVLGWIMEMVAQWCECALCHRLEKTVNFTLCLCYTIQKIQVRKEREIRRHWEVLGLITLVPSKTVKDARHLQDARAACREATWGELRLPANSASNVPIMGVRRSRLSKPLDDSSPPSHPLVFKPPTWAPWHGEAKRLYVCCVLSSWRIDTMR